MIRKEWIDPNEIYLAKPMNPRPLNQGFIESLRESMQEQGFLPQYPVKVFEADTLTCLEINGQPYACVSGMHRTTAAQLAKVEQILCEVYTGDDDAFIEMMMTDNFEYDPAQNSELGQVFSQREKRKACQRLLYIPKFLKMTNSALAAAWHTNEANIRRWRKEVVASFDGQEVSSNDEGGAPTFPETLSRVGITPERLQELKAIDDSREREDADGNTVQIRTAPREMTDDEKSEFWNQIREDAGWHNDGWLKAHGIKDFDYVRGYLAEKFNINNGSRMYDELTTQQLRQVHGWILGDDPELIAGCKAIAEVWQKARALRDELSEACDSVKKWLLGEFVQGNEWSQAYKDCKAAFTDAARQFGYGDYNVASYEFSTVEGKPETFKAAIDIVALVQHDIRDEVPWVVEFRQKMEKDILAKRQTLEKNWIKSKRALADAFQAYPRNISIGAFCYALEDEYYEKSGTYLKLLSLKEPSNRVHNDTLKSQIKYFKQAAKDLAEDAKWVQAITEEPEPSVDTTEFEGFEITHIYIEVTSTNGKVFHPEGAVFTEGNKYDYDEDDNLKSKGLNLNRAAIACLSDATKVDILKVCRNNKFSHYTSHFDIEGAREENRE